MERVVRFGTLVSVSETRVAILFPIPEEVSTAVCAQIDRQTGTDESFRSQSICMKSGLEECPELPIVPRRLPSA